jgi:hypothetical protein
VLLEILLDPEEIFDHEGEFAERIVGRCGAVEEFSVDPAGIGPAQEQGPVLGQMPLDQVHDQGLHPDSGTLEGSDGKDQIETAQVEIRQSVEVVAVRTHRGGETPGGQGEGIAVPVDTDDLHLPKPLLSGKLPDRPQFVTSVDAQVEDSAASGDLQPLKGPGIGEEERGFLLFEDAAERTSRAVFLRPFFPVKTLPSIGQESEQKPMTVVTVGGKHPHPEELRQCVPTVPGTAEKTFSADPDRFTGVSADAAVGIEDEKR